MANDKHIAVVGGGLVGSMISLYLSQRGYHVTVFERRPDMRISNLYQGRSINLALSARGILSLDELGLADSVQRVAIPMHGRMVHDAKGHVNFQPYGKEGQFIRSVSRSDLNVVLMNAAETAGVKYVFDHRCVSVNVDETEVTFRAGEFNQLLTKSFDIIVGADGAYSAVRSALQITDRFNFSQDYIEHGYKELHIPAGNSAAFRMEQNALHIWPRESFMMIALPNTDGSFTCTLFFPFEGHVSFQSLKSDEAVEQFFIQTFPDAVPLMPTLLEDYNRNPVSSLVTVKCFPWKKNNTFLIGDAAHAIVPFYGQGMNAGFEDCRILNRLLDEYNDNWEQVLKEFQEHRKRDTDSIAQLALDNFIEMRDHVADADFVLRKKIEARLHQKFPEQWIPLYSMVTFSPHIRYSGAYATGIRQKIIMDKVLQMPGIEDNWENLDFDGIVKGLSQDQESM